MIPKPKMITTAVVACIMVASCGGGDSETSAPSDDAAEVTSAEAQGDGIRLVSAPDGAAMQADPPEDLVILDVRTPEEFDEGHLEGAIMIDFYSDDFAEQIGELDPNVPYLLYCRSGNRSGQTAEIMEGLNFSDVADVDGGIVSWLDAGLPVVK